MSNDKSVDILFREHSFEEIESVRDNLASEIDKRTELLKSIVKEKYKDVVDTSDGIQSLKSNLAKVERSISRLDKCISNFHQKIRDPLIAHSPLSNQSETSVKLGPNATLRSSKDEGAEEDLKQLLQMMAEVWDHFDRANFKRTVKLYNDAVVLSKKCEGKYKSNPVFDDVRFNLARCNEIIKNNLWYKIQSVQPNQIGLIANCDDDAELYRLSLQSSIEFLVKKFRKDILDNSFQAQIRRYHPYSYFNTETNTIDLEASDMKPPQNGYIQIPKVISPELSTFLFDVCRAINTIAGLSLASSSMLESLKMTMLQIIDVYTNLLNTLNELDTNGSRTRRALQLCFDLRYMRIILNNSRNLSLIDELESRISSLMTSFEDMLDRVELYMISDALYNNALDLSRSTIRLYGLLIPYLQ